MAKKPVIKNNQINKAQKETKTALPKTTTNKTTTKKPTPKKPVPQKAKVSVIDNLSILKSSPYLKQNNEAKTAQKQLSLKDLFEKNLLSQKEEKLEKIFSEIIFQPIYCFINKFL